MRSLCSESFGNHTFLAAQRLKLSKKPFEPFLVIMSLNLWDMSDDERELLQEITHHQLQQPPQSEGSSGVPTERPNKRAPRGTAGTFNGKRPPKDPAKLALFEARREAHFKRLEEAKQEKQQRVKKEPTEQQKQYQEFMRVSLQGDNSPTSFQRAIQQYRTMILKRPAASDAHVQPTPREPAVSETCTPKKKRNNEATMTPDKEVPRPSSSASSSTSK